MPARRRALRSGIDERSYRKQFTHGLDQLFERNRLLQKSLAQTECATFQPCRPNRRHVNHPYQRAAAPHGANQRPGGGDGVRVNPSGGALAGNPMFAAGLARIGMAAREIFSGRAARALGHATSGPALQQNLVCVMEARP